MKYDISREFFPYSHFKPPINRAFLALAVPFMRTPRFIYKDKDVCTVRPDYFYYSPAEAKSLSGLPAAYIETAEIDCLHDDGILYAERLGDEGIDVVLNETRGTIHGFDNAQRARATEEALVERIKFLKKYFA